MDDFNLATLNESRNEWSARLVNIICPHIVNGFDSLFKEAYELCIENEEDEKYLLTFQNFLSRIPKWNNELIQKELQRIVNNSNCSYLEDLITCVHIVQLKALTCVRVGNKQKQIDIDIPKLDNFIHNIYILVARKLYTNIFLFELEISPLEKQKNNREIELIVKECILNAIRSSIPIEHILKIYLDETVEEDITISEEIINKKLSNDSANKETKLNELSSNEIKTELPNSLQLVENIKPSPLKIKSMDDTIKLDIKELSHETAKSLDKEMKSPSITPPNPPSIKFNDIDSAISTKNIEEKIRAPKTIDRLEQISEERNIQRKKEEEEEENNDKIKILDNDNSISIKTDPPPFLDDIIHI